MTSSYSARSRAIEPSTSWRCWSGPISSKFKATTSFTWKSANRTSPPPRPSSPRDEAALAAGHRYTSARGLPQLREAIAGFYAQRYRLSIDPERILITPGGSGALLLASSLLVDPGKHWLLADPGYPCNRHFLRLVEGAAQLVPVGPEMRYQLTLNWSSAIGIATALARWWHRRPTPPGRCSSGPNWPPFRRR